MFLFSSCKKIENNENLTIAESTEYNTYSSTEAINEQNGDLEVGLTETSNTIAETSDASDITETTENTTVTKTETTSVTTTVLHTTTTKATTTSPQIYPVSLEQQIVNHYEDLWEPDGEYVCSEAYDNGSTYRITLRYCMSDERANEIIANGGRPSANILVDTIVVDKNTGKVMKLDGEISADSWYPQYPCKSENFGLLSFD